MRHTISGEIAQCVRLDFEPGDYAWTSRGSLMSYSADLDWQLKIPGGVGGAVRRSFSGEGASLTYLHTDRADQHALVAAKQPGHLMEWDLERDGPVLTTRGSFLAAWGPHVDISVTVARRAGAALFGGAGLFLQHISGSGTVLVHASGDFVEQRLLDGERIVVSTGNLAAFAHGIDYDVQGVGGCRKILFGGEGLFMTRLTGPGRVLLQTLKRTSAVSQSGSS